MATLNPAKLTCRPRPPSAPPAPNWHSVSTTGFMGRQNNKPTSIALLQERFRQLQRLKEMREEREQQRAFSQGERSSSNAQCAQPMWFVHPDLVRPSRPTRGPPPSCWLDSHGDHTDLQALEISLSMGLWPNQSTSRHPVSSNEPDVDTTLHL
ncbi:hypothetical protein BHM03_00019567 [Ensete ventricosum]|nr:hypothetical protein BHM03_00019567 [Ensete ventricosum]